ncbi:MAG TPA: hypothetical protein VG889_16070 [Rhizomicrobium sp.]|nr:hypothetical protein [Rhizomicrobium sp.]
MIRIPAATGLVALALTTAAQADLTISTAPTRHVTCTAGVCKAGAANAVLNVDQLTGLLAAGDVTVKPKRLTGLVVAAPITWANASSLTFEVLPYYKPLTIAAPIVVEGTGGLSITAWDLLYRPGGRIDFWDTSSQLAVEAGISFGKYTLVNDLAALAAAVASNPSGHYALARDYDAGGDGTYSGSVVSTTFDGSFQGLGHTVSNLSLGGSGDVGLFANASGNAGLSDVRLQNVNILAGVKSHVGALVGSFRGRIYGASSSGSVTAGDNCICGGLAGSGHFVWGGGQPATIARSSSSAAVTVNRHGVVGGLAGSAGAVTLSHATGNIVFGPHSITGGLLAFPEDQVLQSWASGNQTPRHPGFAHSSGGLLGLSRSDTRVAYSYSMGSVMSGGDKTRIGGFIAELSGGPIEQSYSVSPVLAPDEASRHHRGSRVGAFLGYTHDETIVSDYWDIDTSGMTKACGNRCDGIVGLHDAQLKAHLPDGFDTTYWAQSPSINNGYPYLIDNPPE